METIGYISRSDDPPEPEGIMTVGMATPRLLKTAHTFDTGFQEMADKFLKATKSMEGASKSLPRIDHPRRKYNKIKKLKQRGKIR